MKKVKGSFAIILVLLMLVLTVSVSASKIKTDKSESYYLVNVYDNVTGLYALCLNDTIIDYVMTSDLFIFFENEWLNYLESESFSNGEVFYDYIVDLVSDPDPCNLLTEALTFYQSEKYTNEIDNIYEEYKSTVISQGGKITPAGFSEYILNNYGSFYHNYINGSQSVFTEMYSAGASSSSSSGGSSSGSTPGENQGEHYGASHDNTNHIVTDSDCCYNPGYNDGLLDGEDNYKNSEDYQNVINEENQKAIEEYFNSEEYTSAMESLKTEIENTAVQQYKEGDEYKASIDSAYIVGSENGVASAYEKAADEMYNLGKAEGFNEFRNSQECVDVMDSCYGQGWKDGENHANENAINPGGVIVTVILILAGSALLLVLSRIKRKKKK
ncbi:MAG: hypothetical protein J6A95_01420 [Clostridia bacterium]|nr:hypothetical protein [Clostridia bacterium]